MNRKELLERYQAVMREQRDFLNNTVSERLTADPTFDFTKDEAYVKREAEINSLSVMIQADKNLEERERAFDHSFQTRESRRSDSNEDQKDIEIRNFAQYLNTGDRTMIQQRANMA